MAIPPFPSQDLAKLVLGYLMEEQLMTAYDEFLQASPFLDAYKNEYDRILMTSLKHILAEYRAVKIYVETCKPISLRKKLLQCSNLVDVMTYLVLNFDTDKLHDVQPDKSRQENFMNSTKYGCHICNSARISTCTCRNQQTMQTTVTQDSGQSSQIHTNTADCSVEATPLTDLPGNNLTTRNNYERNSTVGYSNLNYETNYESNLIKLSHIASQLSVDTNLSNCSYSTQINHFKTSTNECGAPSKSATELKKMEEFDKVLNSVIAEKNNGSQRMSTTGTFHDFANGVKGTKNLNLSVPDSSNSENVTQIPVSKQCATKKTKSSKKAGKEQQLALSLKNSNKSQTTKDGNSENHNQETKNITSMGERKPEEHKVTILSDVRVENSGNHVKPKLLSNATSTPLLQMQTIVINGTPAYKPRAPPFTKDEIMAMPTIILVPTSGPPGLTPCEEKTTKTQSKISKTSTSTTSALQPITIDISSDSPSHNQSNPNGIGKTSDLNTIKTNQISSSSCMVLKPVDTSKNASVPKDVLNNNKSSTPHVLPILRKSSSTPRRNSHIRVLDFNTPRRILHETINEIIPTENHDPNVETVISGSPNLVVPDTNKTEFFLEEDTSPIKVDIPKTNFATKENLKKKNWDADLRVLASVGSPLSPNSRPKQKPRSRKKKTIDVQTDGNNTKRIQNSKKCRTPDSKKTKKISPKTKTTDKKKQKITEIVLEDSNQPMPSSSIIPIKPTINIISNAELGNSTIPENDKSQNSSQPENKSDDKITKSDDRIDTPEMERLSLQNVIGAKLNISDILETPYKQALYDIQMETPRFLGPDLPNDLPMSDIKIMNIPTPRFFDTPNISLTPKPSQATPSSYSSRPTDYSSGSSYYKPDDYMPVPDLRPAPCSISKDKQVTEKIIIEIPTTDDAEKVDKPSRRRSSRPVRQCTKNVSYRNSPGVKAKVEDKSEAGSICSDTVSVHSICVQEQKEVTRKPKAKPSNKNDVKKKVNSSKKQKTPTKAEHLKSKMKYTSPSFNGSKNKRSPLKLTTKNSKKYRSSCHEKSIHSTPMVIPLLTKSRRKSSTPRKLNCTKNFNPESSGENVKLNADTKNESSNLITYNSDAEQLQLHWSDDGSQDSKQKELIALSPMNGVEDISKIKEFIEITNPTPIGTENMERFDLVQKSFDVDVAKSIKQDLQGLPQNPIEKDTDPKPVDEGRNVCDKQGNSERTIESDCSAVLQIVQDENDDEVEEIEMSIHDCNEDTANFISYQFDDAKDCKQESIVKLKDKFCMEVCIEDGVDVMLRATSFVESFHIDPLECDTYSAKETEAAVKSISNYERLYTPLKNAIYDIFDSTLTSLDTPLRVNSPIHNQSDTTVAEIVLEVEQIVEKSEVKKRKRDSVCSDDSFTDNKKPRPETQYLLNSTNIQNIDIESVLSKLHGP